MTIFKKPQPGSFQAGSHFTGCVICRLRSEFRTMRAEDLLQGSGRAAAARLAGLLDELGVKSVPRLVKSIDLDTLFELERSAVGKPLAPQNSLADYWAIDVAHRDEDLRDIVAAVKAMPEVADAYLDVQIVPATVNPTGNPLFTTQGYLMAAPQGIDAQWAWGQAGGDGAGVVLADVEEGWNVTHEDLASANPTLIAGVNRTPALPSPSDANFAGWNHGTSALGIIAARDNTAGIVGIAPNLAAIRLASVWNGSSTGHVVDALAVTMTSLSPGDIVMLELQTAHQAPGGWPNLYPIEVKDAERDAIRLAVSARNLVVIAAAGNNGDDLDNYVSPQGTFAGKRVLDRNSADFQDSGSIMVASASSAVPHERLDGGLFDENKTNFGSRIDCYGWGEDVVTTGGKEPFPDSTPPNQWYRQHFTGTSAATPIVAGAAALLQGMNKASTGVPLSGLQMRALLSDPDNGTKPVGWPGAKIGVMPDLHKLSTTLALTPDIAIRDFLGDDGAVPSTGTLARSPDIIVRNAAITDAQTEFGEGSINANRDDLDSTIVAGSDATVYLRATNRGASEATDVVGKAWWSEPATLVTPDLWNFIGQTAPFAVPADKTLVVSPPITWADAPLGHVCLVATIGCARDPGPIIPKAYDDWAEYEDLIRDWNNIAWRNIITVSALSGRPQPLPFRMVGAPRDPEFFDLEIELSLPDGSETVLEASVGDGSFDIPDVKCVRDVDNGRQTFTLPNRGTVQLNRVKLPPGSANKALLTVTLADGQPSSEGRITLKQRFRDIEAGRITWCFVDSAPPQA